jgi:hypothetical protein
MVVPSSPTWSPSSQEKVVLPTGAGGSAVRFSPAELEGFADAGARLFLAAYGRS